MFIVVASLFLVRLPFLVVAGQENNSVLYLPLVVNKTFSLYYVHSVHKTPVWENFSLGSGDQLVLTSTIYQSLGVGIPFLPGEGRLVNDRGRFMLTGLDRRFSEINLQVTSIAGQAVIYRDKKYDLNRYFASGDLIRIRVIRYRLGSFLWQKFAHEGGTA